MSATLMYERARTRAQRGCHLSFFRNIDHIVRLGGMDYAEAVEARGSMARATKKRPRRSVVIKKYR